MEYLIPWDTWCKERWLVHHCRTHVLGRVDKVGMDHHYTASMLPALMSGWRQGAMEQDLLPPVEDRHTVLTCMAVEATYQALRNLLYRTSRWNVLSW